MGLLNKVRAKRDALVFETLVKQVSAKLSAFCKGMPLGDGEAEMVVMLSPHEDDTAVYLVAMNAQGAVSRVAAKYSGVELAALLSGKLKAAGVDLGTPAGMVEPLKDIQDECIG